MKKLIFVLLALASTFAVSQTTVAPFVNPKVQFFNGAAPCSGCLLSTFAAGQSTPLATYSESTGTTPNANPVVLDANGMASIYLTSASYKFVLKTAANVTIWTQDNVSWANLANTVSNLISNGTLQVIPATAATSGANQSGPNLQDCGNYWTGSISAADCWTFSDVLGTGANPTSTLNVTHSGSSGVSTISIPGNVSVGGTLGAKNDEQIRIASQFGGADWCANVTLADSNLGANAGEIWVDANQTISACATMFTLTAQHRLRFTQGGQYKVSNKLTVPAGGSIYGLGGGPGETSQVLTNTVTISAISGTFPTSTAVVAYHDVAHTELNGVNIDCQNISNAIGLLYDSDNTPPSSLNTFFNFVIKGCHQSVVVGIPSNVATAPASCQGNPNQSGCFQMDTDKFENFQIYGNCSDLTSEGFHINSANGMQNSVIHRGNIQCTNIGIHTVATNGTFRFDNVNGGSPIGTTPIFILTEINVAQSADMLGMESEGGNWTGGAVVDHSCNPLGTNGSPTWIGNSFNGNNVTVDGCEQITDIGSNNTASSTFTVGGTANVIAFQTSKWTASGSGKLTTFNLGTGVFPSTLVSQDKVEAQAAGCANATGSVAGDVQACRTSTTGSYFLGSDGLSILNRDSAGNLNSVLGFRVGNGTVNWIERAAPSGAASTDQCYGDSTAHTLKCSYNNGTFFQMTQTIGTGNVTTAGTAVTNGTTQDQTGITVTGAATTDACTANLGAALPATWQTGIRFWCDVTATNTVTVHLQNPTAGSITPAATAVNVRVTR